MELVVIALVGGVLLALVLGYLIMVITGRAVDNLIDWLVYTFASDEAVRRREREIRRRDGTEQEPREESSDTAPLAD